MTNTERAAFRDEVKQYLLENPQVITEAMQVLQNHQNQAAVAQDGSVAQILSGIHLVNPA